MIWRLLYNLVLTLAFPLVWLRLLYRGTRAPGYKLRRAERFGAVPDTAPGKVWFHAVSAGETNGAAPLIRELLQQRELLITSMTPTGSDRVKELFGEHAGVTHCYAPYDFYWAVQRFLNATQPCALVIMETELWPNMIRACARRRIPVYVVNARLSERSARGYGRAGGFTRSMLADISHIWCQYPSHRDRFISLGAAPERVTAVGSLKFDVPVPDDLDARVAELRRDWVQDRPCWVAASTHDGEELAALQAHREIQERHPGALLVLVPRHPERFDLVAALCRAAGFATARLTSGAAATAPEVAESAGPDVLVGDRMGELVYLYGCGRTAFVGGSLVPVGGHNPIEAALHGIPVVMGPHTHDIPDIAELFVAAGCMAQVTSGAELGDVVAGLMHSGDAPRFEAAAAALLTANGGALKTLAHELLTALAQR